MCSGGGGLDLGIRLALPRARTVCYVEREVAAAGVLAKAIAAGLVDDAPIWSDLRTFDARAWRGSVDLVVGGFPCQPHSAAGKRLGEADPRNLWPDVARLVHEVKPAGCFFENVPGILPYYWREIRPVLQAMGFTIAEGIFSAAEVGAPHLRERVFWLAVSNDRARNVESWLEHEARTQLARCGGGSLANGESGGQRERGQSPERDRLTDGSDSGLADASGSRVGRLATRQRRGGPRAPDAERGGGALEHAGCGGSRVASLGRSIEDVSAAPGASEGMADAGLGQLSGSGPGPAGGTGFRSTSAAVGNTASKRCVWPEDERADSDDARARTGGRVESERASDDLGDANGARYEGQGPAEPPGRAFPPGPGQRWEGWLSDWPGTEPAVRRDADGLAFRRVQLRVLGNGVVPVVAAHAFRTLATRMVGAR